MSIGGSGSGSGIGSSPQLSIRETETTASTEVAKSAMRIVNDTLAVSLIVVDKDFLKYQSPPSSPTLKPLENVRVATSFTQPNDDSWHSAVDQMVSLMPSDFQTLYLAVQQLPKSQQPSDFILLTNTLQTFAQLIGWTAASSFPTVDDSPEALKAEANLLLPYVALNSSTQDSATILGHIQQYLETVGPNDPNYDTINGYVQSLSPLIEDLNTALLQLTQPNTENEGRANLAQVSDKLGTLASQFDRLYNSNDLQMLGNTIHTLETAAQALSLSQPGSASMLQTLSMANLGINSNQSSLGMFGSGFNAITDAFKDGINQATGGNLSSASVTLFNQLATTMFATALMIGALNYENTGASANSKDTSPESASEKNFGYGLLLQILQDSNSLSTVSSQVSNAADIKGSNAQTASSLLTTMTQLFLISASVHGQNLSAAEPLLKSQGNSLQDGIAVASNLVSEGVANDSLSGENAAHLNVYLKQASIASDQNNPEGISAAIDSSIELTGTTPTTVSKDVNDLKSTSRSIQNNLVVSKDEIASNCTGVHIAA